MSRSNWSLISEVRKLGGQGWFWYLLSIFSISLAAAIVIWGSSKQAEYERAASERTAKYQQYSYGPALRACLGKPMADKAKCVNDARNAERENARDERDLEAQRVAALWTYVMGVAAITGMLLSAIGVGLVWTTFRETRDANKISRESVFRQLRAYVTVESVERERNIRVGEWPEFDCVNITMHNSGVTPANCVKIIYDRIEVIDGALVNIPTEVRLTAIGGQSRKVKTLAWVCLSSVLSAKLAIPRNISGKLFYQAVIPDESGKFIEFIEPFDLEAYSPTIRALKLDDNGFIKPT
jgi:hypothetical protein